MSGALGSKSDLLGSAVNKIFSSTHGFTRSVNWDEMMSVQMKKCNLYGRDLYGRDYY